MSKLELKCIHIRLRACRRPSIFSPAESAPPPNVRDVLFSLLQGADPLDPKAPQGPHPHPNPPRDPRGPKGPGGRGPRGTQGRLRRPWGGWAHGTLWGYSEAIRRGKPFRMEGSFEIKVVSGLGFETVPEMNPKLIIWSIHVALGRKGFKTFLKLIFWSIRAALGPKRYRN